MQITDLLRPDQIVCCNNIGSKKRALERMSELLAGKDTGLTAGEVFEHLIGRERLGSTGFGKGTAIPHSRVPGLKRPLAAFIGLENGVDFDAIDNEPVDLFFGLLVPEQSSDDHLQLLSQIAEIFNETQFVNQLRSASSDDALFELLSHWEPRRVSA